MPDGYASNLGRCVNIAQGKFFDMKSHDYHVFMDCLLPIALRKLFDHVWRPLTYEAQTLTWALDTTRHGHGGHTKI